MKAKSVVIFLAICSSLFSCVHRSAVERMSATEMQEHGLLGVIDNVELCPMEFNVASQTHRKTGECKWVRCLQENGKIVCEKSPKPFDD